MADRVSLTEAAMRLRVSYWRAREMVLRGEVLGGKVGRQFWVDAADLSRLAEQQAGNIAPGTV